MKSKYSIIIKIITSEVDLYLFLQRCFWGGRRKFSRNDIIFEQMKVLALISHKSMIISQFYVKLHLWLWEMFKNAISQPFGHVEIEPEIQKNA